MFKSPINKLSWITKMKKALSIIALLFFILPASVKIFRFLNTDKADSVLSLWDLLRTYSLYMSSLAPAACGFIGLGVIVDALEYKPKWLFKAMITLGIIWLLCYPVGSAIGLCLLVYALGKRKKFTTLTIPSN